MVPGYQIVISVLSGVFIGSFAAYGDTLPNDGQLNATLVIANYFNTPTLWALSAFLIGNISRSKISALASGLFLLLIAVISYYIYGITLGNRTEIMMETIIKAITVWSILAIIIGPIYSLAGYVMKSSPSTHNKMFALLLLQILLISENVYYLLFSTTLSIENLSTNLIHFAMILFGLSLPFVFLKDIKNSFVSVIISIFASILGIIFLYVLFQYTESIGV